MPALTAALRATLVVVLAQGCVAAAQMQCDGAPSVRVWSRYESDVAVACAGAADAASFLSAQGLDTSKPVGLELVDALPGHASASAVGCYLDAERRAFVLTYAAFRKRKTWFGLPIDPALYRSLVAHEVAHAIAAASFRVEHPTIQAKEYIAYVTMFSKMIPAQRERVLAKFPGEGFKGDWQMTTTIYLLDPLRFGAQAYRHFLKPEHGSRYLHDILAGDALVE